MSGLPTDRNLLFGIVALRMNLIDRFELLEATREWVNDTTRTLGEVLQAQSALADQDSSLIDALVVRHLEQNSDDIERSLAELLSVNSPEEAQGESDDTVCHGEPAGARRQSAIDVMEPERDLARAQASAVSLTSDPASASRPETAARYRNLWPHARGGLGEIFVAEDTELHRRVALKEIQSSHARNLVSRERFVAEAEITGNLEHPGIVPVYGLGTYSDGRPFYAMRFIKGENLTTAIRRFHAEARPDFMGREFRWLLRRFMDVCNPIAYAHSRGVLHRDLKPGNIMLGPFGETLVMDWGVAKLVGGSALGETVMDDSPIMTDEPAIRPRSGSVTLTGQTVGTPVYMSPEQAGGRLDALGPASDVYSLGATLYVLLTNRRPFDGETNVVLQNVQHGRFRAPRQINSRVPKGLDAICSRAMALQPCQRYGSALALAEDIERWLADESVSARKDSWLDRARRWVRRHQPLVAGWAAAIGVALFALVIAVPVLSLAWGNEAAARRNEQQLRIMALQKAEEAQAQRIEAVHSYEAAIRERAKALVSETAANDERDRAEKALKFLVDAFRRPDPSVDGRSLKVVDLLDQAVRDVGKSLADQPLMAATLLSAIGQTFGGLGMSKESFPVFQRAATLRRVMLGEDHPDTLTALHNLAMAYQDAGRLDQAIPILEATLAKRRARLGDQADDTIESMNDLAVAYWETGQVGKAIPLYEATLLIVRAKVGDDHADTLTIMDNLAVACAAGGQAGRAISLHQAALAKLRVKLGDDHLTTLVTMNNLARAYETGGRTGESIRLYETTLPKLRAKLGDDHPTTLTAMRGLARAYQAAGQLSQAVTLFEATLAKRRVKLGDAHPDTILTTFELASAYVAAGQPAQAVPLFREFLDRTEKVDGDLPAKVREVIPQARKNWEALTRGSPQVQPRAQKG